MQFVYEAANCCLFYQFKDALDITHLWKRVANVPGSIVTANNQFPLLANDTVPYNPDVNSNAPLPKGAGNANNIGPPSTSLTSLLVSTQVPSSATSIPAMFTGGACSVSINTAVVLGMMVIVVGTFLLSNNSLRFYTIEYLWVYTCMVIGNWLADH